MQSFLIESNQAGQRLDKFLHKYLKSSTTGFIYKMLRKKNIVLNGKRAEGNEILKIGDQINTYFSDDTFHKLSMSATDNIQNKSDITQYLKAYKSIKNIEIIYEDDDILIINKPANVLTQKAEGKDLSLNEWLIGYLLNNNKITENTLHTFKPSVLNRLDRNTSGLVLCGVSLLGSQTISKFVHDRSISKKYRTIVKGKITKPGTLTGSISKDTIHNKVAISEGNTIITKYNPIEYNNDITYLEIELVTGKTHQIRAHMASVGHPLLGDPKYGDQDQNEILFKEFHTKRQLLHAYSVSFMSKCDPLIQLNNKKFIAQIPLDMQEVLDLWLPGTPEDSEVQHLRI